MSRKQALRAIRRLARDGLYAISDYCERRMVERDVMPEDVECALCHAVAAREQANARWRVEGPDIDQQALSMVVELRANLVVVTLFRGDEDEPENH